jgi:hypothetical protein
VQNSARMSSLPQARITADVPGFSVVSTICCDGAVSSIFGSGLDIFAVFVVKAMRTETEERSEVACTSTRDTLMHMFN